MPMTPQQSLKMPFGHFQRKGQTMVTSTASQVTQAHATHPLGAITGMPLTSDVLAEHVLQLMLMQSLQVLRNAMLLKLSDQLGFRTRNRWGLTFLPRVWRTLCPAKLTLFLWHGRVTTRLARSTLSPKENTTALKVSTNCEIPVEVSSFRWFLRMNILLSTGYFLYGRFIGCIQRIITQSRHVQIQSSWLETSLKVMWCWLANSLDTVFFLHLVEPKSEVKSYPWVFVLSWKQPFRQQWPTRSSLVSCSPENSPQGNSRSQPLQNSGM